MLQIVKMKQINEGGSGTSSSSSSSNSSPSSQTLRNIEKKLDFLIKCRAEDNKEWQEKIDSVISSLAVTAAGIAELKKGQEQTHLQLANIKQDLKTIKEHVGVTSKARLKARSLKKLNADYIAKCDAKLKSSCDETRVMLITKFKTIPVNEYRLLFEDDVCFKYSGGKQIPKGRIDITTSPTFNLLAETWNFDMEKLKLHFNSFGRKNRNRVSQYKWYQRNLKKPKMNDTDNENDKEMQDLVEFHLDNIEYVPVDEADVEVPEPLEEIVMVMEPEETKVEQEDYSNGFASDDDDGFLISYDGCWKSNPDGN